MGFLKGFEQISPNPDWKNEPMFLHLLFKEFDGIDPATTARVLSWKPYRQRRFPARNYLLACFPKRTCENWVGRVVFFLDVLGGPLVTHIIPSCYAPSEHYETSSVFHVLLPCAR